MKPERWMPIVDHPNYEVSDHGRVRSIGHFQRVRAGGRAWHQGKLRKPASGSKGHLYVVLAGNKHRSVHQLVAEAFIGPRPPGMLALHRNDDKTDNRPENLYYGSYSDNAFDAVRNGSHWQASKTHCKHGHLIDGVRLRPDGSVRQRYCKQCNNDSSSRSKTRSRCAT